MRFNAPDRITAANAGQCKAQIAEALHTQSLMKLKQDSQFHELSRLIFLKGLVL